MSAKTVPVPQTVVPIVETVTAYEESTTSLTILGKVTSYKPVTRSTPAATPVVLRCCLVVPSFIFYPVRRLIIASLCVQVNRKVPSLVRPLDTCRQVVSCVQPFRNGTVRPVPQVTCSSVQHQKCLVFTFCMSMAIPILTVPKRRTSSLTAFLS